MIVLPSLPETVEAGKLFHWNRNLLIRRSCPVCGEDSSNIVCIRPDSLAVNQCKECSLVYLPDTPGKEDIDRFYEMYGDQKGYEEFSAGARPLGFIRKWRMSRAHFGVQILNDFGGLHGRTICEIGCSFGLFLQLAGFCGAIATGIELDQKARISIAKHLGVPVFADIDDVKQQQDIFCAFSVFEHLVNPKAVLEKIYEKCANDGRLLLSMPNGGNCEVVGPAWAGFRVDLEHLNYFSVKTLSKILSDNGFFVEQYWHLNQLATNRTNVRPDMNRFLRKAISSKSQVTRSGAATVIVLARKI